jgi:hypothetical protein
MRCSRWSRLPCERRRGCGGGPPSRAAPGAAAGRGAARGARRSRSGSSARGGGAGGRSRAPRSRAARRIPHPRRGPGEPPKAVAGQGQNGQEGRVVEKDGIGGEGQQRLDEQGRTKERVGEEDRVTRREEDVALEKTRWVPEEVGRDPVQVQISMIGSGPAKAWLPRCETSPSRRRPGRGTGEHRGLGEHGRCRLRPRRWAVLPSRRARPAGGCPAERAGRRLVHARILCRWRGTKGGRQAAGASGCERRVVKAGASGGREAGATGGSERQARGDRSRGGRLVPEHVRAAAVDRSMALPWAALATAAPPMESSPWHGRPEERRAVRAAAWTA